MDITVNLKENHFRTKAQPWRIHEIFNTLESKPNYKFPGFCEEMNNALVRRAILLSWFTIAYNMVEGVVSIAFGLSDNSISLAGFGADSLVEVVSALLVLWRFRETISLEREKRATLGIGILFTILAIGTGICSIVQLGTASHPETTLPGVVISILSLGFMCFLWNSKLKVGKALNSTTVLKDAACSLACVKLSVVLFFGSLLYWIFPSLWWTDSVAALLLCGFIGWEGWETVKAFFSSEPSGACGCKHD